MEFKSFKQILKNASNRQPMPFIRRVQAVWHTAVIIALGGITGIIIFSLFLYIQIQNDALFQAHTSSSEINSLIKQTRLESVLKEFDLKAERFINITVTKPKITDPSL